MSARIAGYAHPIEATADLSDAALEQVTKDLQVHAEENDRTARFPWEGIYRVHEAGLLIAPVKARFGGQHAGALDTVRIFLALGKGDPAVALIAAMTYFVHLYNEEGAEFVHWPPALYQAILTASRTRPVLLNSINAEPSGVTRQRVGLPVTSVRRGPGGWVLTGHKTSATGSEGLDYHIVWAHDADTGRPGFALVPGDAAGIEVVKTWDHLGQRASSSHDVIYRDVRLPPENFITRPSSFAAGRGRGSVVDLMAAATYLGAARAGQDFYHQWVTDYATARPDRAAAAMDAMRLAAGEIEAQLLLAESTVRQVATEFDDGDAETAGEQAMLVKLIATRAAVAAVDTAMATLGNHGLTRRNPLERHYRDVLVSRAHVPKDPDALMAAGRRLLSQE